MAARLLYLMHGAMAWRQPVSFDVEKTPRAPTQTQQPPVSAAHGLMPKTRCHAGVQSGGSIRMWQDYFGPGLQYFGVDVNYLCEELFDGLPGTAKQRSLNVPLPSATGVR